MPDYVKKIMKGRAEDLQPGEALEAATIGQPSGTFSRQAMGGLVGVLAAKKVASKREEALAGADETGIAASIPKGEQLFVAISDRRLLFFKVAVVSGNAKELVAEVALRDVHEMSVEKHKVTFSLVVTFVDNSARMFECVKMTKPQAVVDAYNRLKGTRAA